MTKSQRKQKPREFFVLHSEYGMDFKRDYYSFHKTEELAKAMKKYLDLKDPMDKHEIINVMEVLKK